MQPGLLYHKIMRYILSEQDEDLAVKRALILQGPEPEWKPRLNIHGAKLNTAYQQDLNLHIQGQRGEIAVARMTGLPANFCPDTFHDNAPADVGDDIEVRTRSKSWHDLIVRQD